MVGFPHSEILGSKLVRSSPRLIAAYYVLHRLHAPRHPLDALKALDRSHYQCPQPNPSPPLETERKKSSGIVDRSDQINQNSRAVAVSPRGAGQTSSKASLYDVERSGSCAPKRKAAAKLALCVRRYGNGGAGRDRTDDLKLAKLPLSQLSYGPWEWLSNRLAPGLVGPGRLELPTSRLSGVRSNHLSYGPSGSRQRAGSTDRSSLLLDRIDLTGKNAHPAGERQAGARADA
jgi:hypothetical protein